MPRGKITDGLHQRKNGSWEKTATINGKRRWFADADPAKVWQRYWQAIKSAPFEKEQEELGPKFETVANAYLEKVYKMKNGTQKAYFPAVKHAMEWFEGKRMKEIEPYMIHQYLESVPSRARTTVSNYKTVINSIFQLWINSPEWKGDQNPAKLVSLPKGLKRGKRQPPTEKQIQIVKEHYLDPDALPAVCYLCTGGRKGEINALQIQDIDFDNNFIHITKSVEYVNNKPHIHGTKTESGVRIIPLLKMMKDALEPLRSLPPNAYILSGDLQPLSACAYRRRWEAFWRKYGMAHAIVRTKKRTLSDGRVKTVSYTDWKVDVCAHQFRHEYVCMLCMANVPESIAIQLVGHANAQMIHEVYMALKPEMVKEAKIDLDSYLEKGSKLLK